VWGCHFFGYGQPKEFSEHPTLYQIARQARRDPRGDDWDFFVAFVAPTLNGGTEERTAAQ
jgi:hypothetical protein